MDDVDDFIEFVKASKVPSANKRIGDRLMPNTVRRVKKVFDCVIEANLLEDIAPESVNVKAD